MKKKLNDKQLNDTLFQAIHTHYGVKDLGKLKARQMQEIVISLGAMVSSLGIVLIKCNPNLKDQNDINASANEYMEAIVAIMQDSFQTHVNYSVPELEEQKAPEGAILH